MKIVLQIEIKMNLKQNEAKFFGFAGESALGEALILTFY